MRLRPRLALATLAMALPLLVGLELIQRYARDRALTDALVDFANAQMQPAARSDCEASPSTWSVAGAQPQSGEPGRHDPSFGTQLFAYDEAFHSPNPNAPILPSELTATLAGRDVANGRGEDHGRQAWLVLVRMPWRQGPCAVIAARKWAPRGPGPWRHRLQEFVPIVAAVMLTLVLALGPVVRRIRQLAADVRSSAQNAYRTSVSRSGHDEISDLARAFDEASQEIRLQVAAKEQRAEALRSFLENTTHDVMIPLSVLQGHLDELRQQAHEQRPAAVALVGQAIGETHYITSLIRNLSLAAKLEAGQPDLQRAALNLSEVIARVVARLTPIARERRIKLEHAVPEAPVWVDGDVTLIEQALGNMIDNAIRYNRDEGNVAVVLDLGRDGRFNLRVIDDGPGIPDDELSRLAERYFRGNQARTRAPGGRGLGLNIARQVADFHGWALELARSEYGGLQVSFSGTARV
jgi:signal transduction histidine kinase